MFVSVKKIFFILLPLMMIIFTGCNHFANKKVLVVGLDADYAPFGFRDENGEIIGFDIDLANEVADRLNVKFKFKPIDWSQKQEELTSGKIDIIWSGFNITPDREEYVLFSKPYMENRQVILVPKGKGNNIISSADLSGKIIGTQLGAPSDYYISQDQTLKNTFAKFVTYDNYKHAFEDLAADAIDAIVCDELVVRYEMTRHPNIFDFLDITVGEVTEVAIGFRKDDTELCKQVEKVFGEMVEDGTAKKISEKWFHANLINFKL